MTRIPPLAGAGLLACGLVASSPPPARASLVQLVTVTAKEMHSTECLDEWCQTFRSGKPDLFARAYVLRDGALPMSCGMGPVTEDFQNVVEDQVLCNSSRVEGSFKVRFEVWDRDNNNPLVADQATLGAWPEKGFTTGTINPSAGFSLPFTTSPGPSWAIFTVDAVPAVPAFSFDNTNTASFDPQVHERATIAGGLTFPSRIRVEVSVPGGTKVLFEGVARERFSATWDGSDVGGGPVPPGTYPIAVVDISAPAGSTVASGITSVIVAPPPAPRLRFAAITPDRKDGWDFSAGPLTIEATASHGGSAVLAAAPGECGDQLPPDRTIALNGLAAGLFASDWDGLNDYGFPVGWGPYCLTLSGTSTQGAFQIAQRDIKLLPRPNGIQVMANFAPFVPALETGRAPAITAAVVDNEHKDRYAYTMSLMVSAAPAGAGMGTFKPVTITPTCTRAGSCTWPLPASLLTEMAIAWNVTVSEAPDFAGRPQLSATTGWRITDIMPSGKVVRVDVPAVIVPHPDGTIGVIQSAHSQMLDLAYYPGTDLAPGDPTGGTFFPLAVQTAVNEIRGFGRFERFRMHSSAYENWDRIAIWAVNDPVTVAAASNTWCTWSGPSPASFAESVGVLHGVNCRDNTSGVVFSSWYTYPGAGWHELHHAAYDEADEYCCDGWYHDSGNQGNVYVDQSSCLANSSVGSSCHPIVERDPRTGMVITTLPWWASDSDKSDVMGNSNDVENPDDRRAAKRLFDRCRRGEC